MSKIHLTIIGILALLLCLGCENMRGLGAGTGSGGGMVSAKASVEVSYDIDWASVPMAEMPTKYQTWKIETDEYLQWVRWSVAEIRGVRGQIAALFGVSASADANTIANAIRGAIKVEAKLVVEAKASASASGHMKPGEAHAQTQAEGFASVRWETTTTIDPEIQRRMDSVRGYMHQMISIDYVISTMENRGQELNERGMQLHAESVTDLATDPTLAVHLPTIQATLESGSSTCMQANAEVGSIRSDISAIRNALETTFR